MIRIITDSMSDYIHAAHRDSGVLLAFQPLRFGMEEYMDDGVSISQETFYARLRTCTELPKTSLVAMQTWKDVMKQALSDPEDTALVIAGSSRLSGGYQTAVQAAEALRAPERIIVIDSLTASCGEIMLIDCAVRMRDAGATLAQAADAVRELMSRQRLIGLADDLKYLVMGGRLNPLIGKVGGMLSIKPTLKLEGGQIEKDGVVRGLKKGWAWYAEQLKQFPPDVNVPLYIGGADCPETTAMLRQMFLDTGLPLPEIRCVPIGCLIGTHVGPGLTLVCWAAAC
ncbi:MAG: DegV family protein [Clostridiales bacterium]|nr:DegV family protein [Clostridiales bacterium]